MLALEDKVKMTTHMTILLPLPCASSFLARLMLHHQTQSKHDESARVGEGAE